MESEKCFGSRKNNEHPQIMKKNIWKSAGLPSTHEPHVYPSHLNSFSKGIVSFSFSPDRFFFLSGPLLRLDNNEHPAVEHRKFVAAMAFIAVGAVHLRTRCPPTISSCMEIPQHIIVQLEGPKLLKPRNRQIFTLQPRFRDSSNCTLEFSWVPIIKKTDQISVQVKLPYCHPKLRPFLRFIFPSRSLLTSLIWSMQTTPGQPTP